MARRDDMLGRVRGGLIILLWICLGEPSGWAGPGVVVGELRSPRAEEAMGESQPTGVDLGREFVLEAWIQLTEGLKGEYEVDLSPVKQSARVLAAIFSASEKTRRFGDWLEEGYRAWPSSLDFRIGEVVALEEMVDEEKGEEPPEIRAVVQEPRGAAHFVPRLKPIFESLQVPVELVWVAEVESAFNPRAISPVGAAGLYQLMPATARQYGLVLEPEDDRFHPEKNATAAARHMMYLRRSFSDWQLAMAAYNAGHNRVRGLLTKHNAKSFEEIAVYLPLETQLFVPKVAATLARREGVSLEGLTSRLP